MKFSAMRWLILAMMVSAQGMGCEAKADTDLLEQSVTAWTAETLPRLKATPTHDGGFDFDHDADENNQLACKCGLDASAHL